MWFAKKSHNRGYLLLLGSDQFQRERSIVGALRAFDGPIVTVSPKGAVGFNRMFDAVIMADPMDPEATLAAVEEFNRRWDAKPVAAVPVNDWTVATSSRLAAHFSLRGHSVETVKICRNKAAMKAAFIADGLPTPRHRLIRGAEELAKAGSEIGFPLVLKPIDFGGSGGVIRVDRPEDLDGALTAAATHVGAFAKTYHVSDSEFQLEEYFPAVAEVSVEVINDNENRRVITVTDKDLTPEPHFGEVGHVVPSVYNDRADIRELAVKACASLGIKVGMAHVEIRIGGDGRLMLVEVGARPAGDGIMDQVERAFGVNPYVLHVQSYLGTLPDLPKAFEPTGVSAIAFLNPGAGRIAAVTAPASLDVGQADDIVSLYISGTAGKQVQNPRDWSTREGIVETFRPLKATERQVSHLALARKLSSEFFKMEPRA